MSRHKPRFCHINLIMILLVFFIYQSGNPIPCATAADNISRQSDKPEKKEYGKIADEFQERISKKLKASANWLDSFFSEERAEIEEFTVVRATVHRNISIPGCSDLHRM